jgi:uncharacterized membrane protein
VTSTPIEPRRERPPFALWALIAVYVTTFTTIALIKYRYFLYDDIDLAIFAQACHGLLHGSLVSSIRGMHWLGDHSSLVLFLVAPLYALFHDPRTLLVVQTVALALGAWPVYALARHELGDRTVALGCAALYLLYPALGYANLFEFHPEALSTAPLLAAFYFVRVGRVRPALAFATLALLGKEDVALVVLGLALYAAFQRQPGRRALAPSLAALALGSLVISFAVLKPLWGGTEAEYGRMYSSFGPTTGQALLGMIREPLRALATLFGTAGDATDTLLKRQYFVHLLLPLALVPLAAPGALAIALPVVAEHMLSSRTQQHSILYQYTTLVIPFTIAATVIGARHLSRWIAPRTLIGLALLVSLATNVMFGPLLGQGVFQARRPFQRNVPNAEDRDRVRRARPMLDRVPKHGGVVAGFGLLPALSGRDSVHALHHVVSGRYTYSSREYPTPSGVVAVIGDLAGRLIAYPDSGTEQRMNDLITNNRLVPVAVAGDLVLWLPESKAAIELFPTVADTTGAPGRILFDRRVWFLGVERPDNVRAGDMLRVTTKWSWLEPSDRLYLMQWWLLDAHGRPAFSHLRYLGYLIHSTPERESEWLPIPSSLAPGRYTLVLRLGWSQEGRLGFAISDDPRVREHDGMLSLGEVAVTGAESGGPR